MLLCKPARKTGIVFEQTVPKITIRSLELSRDRSYLGLADHYRDFLNNKDTHPFVGVFQHKRICRMDVSGAGVSELGKRIRMRPNDCSMQLFINLFPDTPAGIAGDVLNAFLCYYLSFPGAQFLYATPGIHDHTGCRILEGAGFIFQENIILPSKAASLYLLTRNQFLLKNKVRTLKHH